MNTDPAQKIGALSAQVAIVTGAGRGIGQTIALALAGAGARVALAARSRDQLDETAALIQQAGGQAFAVVVDVTDQSAVEALVDATVQRFGPPDLLVNNAGIATKEATLWELAADDWWRVLEVNVRGPFLCARAVLPFMLQRHGGRIINVASNAGTRPMPMGSAYSVSKAALLRLTDGLAAETREHGVKVFAISPGLVHSAMSDAVNAFKDLPESAWTPPERAGELCVTIASGQVDDFSGRYIHVSDDLAAMARRAGEIDQNDLYTLRVRRLE